MAFERIRKWLGGRKAKKAVKKIFKEREKPAAPKTESRLDSAIAYLVPIESHSPPAEKSRIFMKYYLDHFCDKGVQHAVEKLNQTPPKTMMEIAQTEEGKKKLRDLLEDIQGAKSRLMQANHRVQTLTFNIVGDSLTTKKEGALIVRHAMKGSAATVEMRLKNGIAFIQKALGEHNQ